MIDIKIKIEKEVNLHFQDFLTDWDYKYYMLVGGYGSSKSYHAALKIIIKLLQSKRTALVVRNVFETHRDSTFSLFIGIIGDTNLESEITWGVSPMRIKFKNGSKIIFKGMDKPEKLKSINDVTIVWLEECSEIHYNGFKELLGRLRHPTLSLHFILSTNPVDKANWCYKHFFKDELNDKFVLDDERLYKERIVVLNDTYYHHSVGADNKFIPQDYLDTLDNMKTYDPDLHRVAMYGRFGVNGLRVLPQFEIKPHNEVMACVNQCTLLRAGMDFGFETSYNALVRVAIDEQKKILYIYWEYYKNKMTDDRTAVEIDEFRQNSELIRADSAEPKTIKYYVQQGFRMIGAKKFQYSRLANIKKVKRFKQIVCSNNCTNVRRELESLVFAKDKNGEIIQDEFNIDPHTFSAIWYALDQYEVADLKDTKIYSGRGKR